MEQIIEPMIEPTEGYAEKPAEKPARAPVLAMRALPQSQPPHATEPSYVELVNQATMAASAASETSYAPIREQDRLLPAANIFRIMQREMPEGCKISRDAKYFMQAHRRLPRQHRCQRGRESGVQEPIFCHRTDAGVAKFARYRASPVPTRPQPPNRA